MIISAIILSIVVPIQVSVTKPHFEPFIVQATIDAAVLIGLPSSKAAKAYALKIQAIDPSLRQIIVAPEPVSDRKLFFRNYFK